MFDGIEYRGFSQTAVEALAEHSGVPFGMASLTHGTQLKCWQTF